MTKKKLTKKQAEALQDKYLEAERKEQIEYNKNFLKKLKSKKCSICGKNVDPSNFIFLAGNKPDNDILLHGSCNQEMIEFQIDMFREYKVCVDKQREPSE